MVSELLRRVGRILEAGWSEPLCYDSDGCVCAPDDEGAVRFSVVDAVQVIAGEQDDWWGALQLLEAVLCTPSAGVTLQQWLEAPGRQLREVLAVLDVAVLRARTLEGALNGCRAEG
ncbi:MAG: DUF6197 family protein [Candidatus Acidiferrales bacterium]